MLELVEVVLMHRKAVNNYQQASKVLFTFVSNNQFRQLVIVSPHSLTILNTINTKLSFSELWSPDQNNKPLEIENKKSISFITG